MHPVVKCKNRYALYASNQSNKDTKFHEKCELVNDKSLSGIEKELYVRERCEKSSNKYENLDGRSVTRFVCVHSAPPPPLECYLLKIRQEIRIRQRVSLAVKIIKWFHRIVHSPYNKSTLILSAPQSPTFLQISQNIGILV